MVFCYRLKVKGDGYLGCFGWFPLGSMRGRILSPSQESTSSGSCQSAEAKTRAYIGSVLLSLDTWRMDCLRRTHKERREHRAVRRRRRVHGHHGVGDARRPCGGTTAVQCSAVRRRWRVQLQALLLPLCSSRQLLFLCYGGLAARGAPSGGRNCKFVVVAASSLATAATSGYVRNGFINWLNVTFIELQPLHYHCRRQV